MVTHIEVHNVRWDGVTLRWPGASEMWNWHPIVQSTQLYPMWTTQGLNTPPGALWRAEAEFLTKPLDLLTLTDDQALFVYRLGNFPSDRERMMSYVDIIHRGRFHSTSLQDFGISGGSMRRYIYTADRVIPINEYKCDNLKYMLGDPAIKWIDPLKPEFLTSTVRSLLVETVENGYVGPILADALQDAGFDDETALQSLRANNPLYAVFQMNELKTKPVYRFLNPCGEIAL